MQNYGIILNGVLQTSNTQLDGYKPVKYAALPEFDQLTQAVVQSEAIDEGDYISVGVQVIEVTQEDAGEEDMHALP